MKKNIPNMLSIFRLLCIPLFIYIFFVFEEHRIYSLAVFALASATDILDGYLARRNNWITPAGKILDPLADKLMQMTVLVCLTIKDNFFMGILILFAAKETIMICGAVVVLKKKKDIVVSNWYGKAATVIFFFITTVFIVSSGLNTINIILAVLLAVVLIAALLLYYFKVFRGSYGIKKIKKE